MTSNKATRTSAAGAKQHYASELHLHDGEWINDPYVFEYPVKLVYAADKPNASGKVTIVFEARGESVPGAVDAGRPVTMATDADVEGESKRVVRSSVTDGLIELANLLSDERLPIRDYLGGITLHAGLTSDELAAVGKVLGITPERSYGTTFEVEWRPKGSPAYGPGIRATWTSRYPACPFVFVDAGGEVKGGWVEGGEGEPCKFEQGHDEAHAVTKRPAK